MTTNQPSTPLNKAMAAAKTVLEEAGLTEFIIYGLDRNEPEVVPGVAIYGRPVFLLYLATVGLQAVLQELHEQEPELIGHSIMKLLNLMERERERERDQDTFRDRLLREVDEENCGRA